MKVWVLPSLLLMMLISCTTQDICNGDNDSDLVARFKVAGSVPVADTIMPGVTLFGIREGQSDSLLYDSITLSRIVLPLDPHNDHSRFVLSINDQSDTIRINHTTETYLLSYTCGFATLFTVQGIDHTERMVNDIEIINAVIDAELEQNEEHLWIYF